MIRFARQIRLIPIVLFATISLFVLKTMGLVFDGGYTLAQAQSRSNAQANAADHAQPAIDDAPQTTGSVPTPSASRVTPKPVEVRVAQAPVEVKAAAPIRQEKQPGTQSWAQEMFNFPDVTGSVPESKPAPKDLPPIVTSTEPPPPTRIITSAQPGGTVVASESGRPLSAAERAVLERLNERRQELDVRSRELDIRESLLREAEKRIEGRVGELKEVEARVGNAIQKRDEADAGRLKSLVTMYENMKAKDAAKIFDRLELGVLLEVTSKINPRRMSDIMAQMSPEAAERLTVEMAKRANSARDGAELPKIEGRPSGG